MLDCLAKEWPETPLSASDRDRLRELQQFLVDQVRAYHNQQRLTLIYDTRFTLSENLRRFFADAREAGKAAALAQYLVGAKLQLRFPHATVTNDSWTTKDQQLGRAGDFLVAETVFHVTLAPTAGLLEKCRDNLGHGLHPVLIVPKEAHGPAEFMIEQADDLRGRVDVWEWVAWLGQNLEELGELASAGVRAQAAALVQLYNLRVDAVEFDKSLLIDIPSNLAGNVG
jgi:hypothetical protein